MLRRSRPSRHGWLGGPRTGGRAWSGCPRVPFPESPCRRGQVGVITESLAAVTQALPIGRPETAPDPPICLSARKPLAPKLSAASWLGMTGDLVAHGAD